MNPIFRRAALVVCAAAVVSAVVQLPVTAPTPPSLALTQSGSVTELQITGHAGVPADASAVVLNLTALDSTQPGFVTAYPCGTPRPTASNLNYAPGTIVANSATIPIGTGGRVCLYTHTATNLIADINGWHPAGSNYRSVQPQRLLDTRPAPAPPGQFVETFTGNTGLDRFNFGIYHRGDDANGVSAWPGATSWPGDHDLNCGPPNTGTRTIRRDTNEWIYLCRDHMMTAIGDTDGYSTGYFAPRQTFSNVTQVSWDANVTDLLGRQWWEVSIVPASFNSGVPTCPHCSSSTDFSPVTGLPVYPAGSAVVGTTGRGLLVVSDGIHRDVKPHYTIRMLDPVGAASKAIRRPFTITDNRNGTITVDFGGFDRFTVPGSFPDEFRVVFKDHNYTPDKDGIPAGYTWHWDNIAIGTE